MIWTLLPAEPAEGQESFALRFLFAGERNDLCNLVNSMGQRHQIFIIAKVRKRYRTLAALHNQWLYGKGPLERCLQLLKVLQPESNRVPILQELRAAREKDDGFWTQSHGVHGYYQPFPFIATCLSVGSSFESDVGYSARVHLLRFNSTLENIDNNEGITVVDISNLGALRYCFAFPSTGFRGRVLGKPVKPMRASTYLSRYYEQEDSNGASNDDSDGINDDIEDISDDLDDMDGPVNAGAETLHRRNSLVDRLEAYDLIDAATLNDTWPRKDVVDGSTIQELPKKEDSKAEHQSNSLNSMATDQMLTATLKEMNFDIGSLVEAKQLPGFLPRIRSTLVALAESNKLPSSSTTVRYLELAFVGEAVIDLSIFSNLTSEQLVKAASMILESGSVKSLDLSHLRQLSEADLKKIFDGDNGSRTETLYLLEMPQISLEFVSSLFSRASSRLENIYHTNLLRRPIAETSKYSELMKTMQCPPFTATDSQGSIKQLLWARVVGGPGELAFRKADGVTIDWLRSKPPEVIHKDIEHCMYPAIFPLHDIRLTPTKLVTGLVNYFTCASKKPGSWSHYDLSFVGLTIAKSFAMARSSFQEPSERIGHLPDAIYNASRVAARVLSVHWPIAFPKLKAGEWSIVVVNEHYPYSRSFDRDEEKFRLAFITPKTTTDLEQGYRVKSLNDFLAEWPEALLNGEEATTLAEYWGSKAGFVPMCEEEEINELLPAMRRNVESMEEALNRWEEATRLQWEE